MRVLETYLKGQLGYKGPAVLQHGIKKKLGGGGGGGGMRGGGDVGCGGYLMVFKKNNIFY